MHAGCYVAHLPRLDGQAVQLIQQPKRDKHLLNFQTFWFQGLLASMYRMTHTCINHRNCWYQRLTTAGYRQQACRQCLTHTSFSYAYVSQCSCLFRLQISTQLHVRPATYLYSLEVCIHLACMHACLTCTYVPCLSAWHSA